MIEGPLHPRAGEIYEAGLRRDFLAFMERMTRDYDVRFVPLEELPAFEERDFKDMLHTRGRGPAKLTGAVVGALRGA